MTAGLGALVVGSVFQVGGMFHTNNATGGPGLLATPGAYDSRICWRSDI
jgi:hypothetical protein